MRLYAIGDIHGQLDMLRTVHAFIAEDRKVCGDDTAPVVHLGDYTDRGPDSAGVLDHLIDGAAEGQPWRFVRGNHDRMFREFMRAPFGRDLMLRPDYTWLHPNLGGRDTLRSYGVPVDDITDPEFLHDVALKLVPGRHIRFLEGLENAIQTDHLILVHAGIRPGVPMDQQTEDDLLWIRHEFLDDITDHGKLVVHGHTPVEQPSHYGNHVNLDTGAGYFAPLTAAVFVDRDCWVLTAGGRRPLRP